MTKMRTAALRGMIGQHVHVRRGDVRLASGNLMGAVPVTALPPASKRLWGVASGEYGRLHVAAFDPFDPALDVEVLSPQP